MLDFDCGAGLLACMLATLIHQSNPSPASSPSSSGASPSPNASSGVSPCVRAVCCHEDISNGCFEILQKNTTSHMGLGLAATTPTAESSLTIAASVVTNNATSSAVVTAATSSSTTPTPTSGITLHEYHHQVTNPSNASAPGLAHAIALDRCPLELLVGVDTMVLRMETFMRANASNEGGQSHNNNDTHSHTTDKLTAGGGSDHPHHPHHSHMKGKCHGHNDNTPSSSSYSPSSSLKNLQHFCASLFPGDGGSTGSGGDGGSSTSDGGVSTSTNNTITTVLLTLQASTARVFMNTEHDAINGGNHQEKENSKDKAIPSKHGGMRLSVEGAIVVAQALKTILPATVNNAQLEAHHHHSHNHHHNHR